MDRKEREEKKGRIDRGREKRKRLLYDVFKREEGKSEKLEKLEIKGGRGEKIHFSGFVFLLFFLF